MGAGVSIIGLGKLGSPMAACLASHGVRVVGVDADPAKVEAVGALRAPVFEPGLPELLARCEGRLTTTTSVADAVRVTDLTMIVVPTPSDEDGGFSLAYAHAACEAVGAALAAKDGYHVVCVTSTVMPGSTGGPLRRALEDASGRRVGEDVGLCYSPEFIALGSVIRDFLAPDFLLVGESDERAGDVLCEVYAQVCENDPPVARMSFVEAELAKLAVNAFVTTKITFANTLARICEALPGANVDVVTAALGLDSRIGSRYLKGAISYGGPCFPRDNAALAALARELGAPAELAEVTDGFNRADLDRLRDRVLELARPDDVVAVLGLAYKPGSDVVEASPGAALVRGLEAAGVDVVAWDPAASIDARVYRSLEECVAAADVLVVTTPWRELERLPDVLAVDGRRARLVVDCWRLFPAGALDVETVALGTGPLPDGVAA